jgi:hypothetical protein
MSVDDSLDLLRSRAKMGLNRPAAVVEKAVPAANASDEESCTAFGYLRGCRDRALTLELRFADGKSLALPYGWLGLVQFDRSAGVLLKFVGDKIYLVRVEGSNLNGLVNGSASLYDRGILRHRVSWLREMTRSEVEKAGKGEVTIERIRMLSYRSDQEPQGVEWLEPFRNAP